MGQTEPDPSVLTHAYFISQHLGRAYIRNRMYVQPIHCAVSGWREQPLNSAGSTPELDTAGATASAAPAAPADTDSFTDIADITTPQDSTLFSAMELALDALGGSTQWVVAGAVGVALVTRADVGALVYVVGSLFNAVFSKILKKIINQVCVYLWLFFFWRVGVQARFRYVLYLRHAGTCLLFGGAALGLDCDVRAMHVRSAGSDSVARASVTINDYFYGCTFDFRCDRREHSFRILGCRARTLWWVVPKGAEECRSVLYVVAECGAQVPFERLSCRFLAFLIENNVRAVGDGAPPLCCAVLCYALLLLGSRLEPYGCERLRCFIDAFQPDPCLIITVAHFCCILASCFCTVPPRQSLFYLGTYLVIGLQEHGVLALDPSLPQWPLGVMETQTLLGMYALSARCGGSSSGSSRF